MSLKEQVKGKLNITWEDEKTEERIDKIIKSAVPDMIHILGITDNEFDFSQDGAENTLFLAYCFYEWNHILNEFHDSYSKDIARVRDKHAVEQYLGGV